MVIGIIIITLLVIKIKNGNLKALTEFKLKDLKAYKLMIFSVLCVIGINLLIKLPYFQNNIFYNIFKYIHISSLFAIAMVLAINYKNPGFLIMSAGFFMNLIPIVLNGRMPVKYSALEKTLINNHNAMVNYHAGVLEMNGSLTHAIFANPKAEILSDIIPVTFPHFMAKVISIGDIVITVGIIIAMLYISKENKNVINRNI